MHDESPHAVRITPCKGSPPLPYRTDRTPKKGTSTESREELIVDPSDFHPDYRQAEETFRGQEPDPTTAAEAYSAGAPRRTKPDKPDT
jgi:hypothetical protein